MAKALKSRCRYLCSQQVELFPVLQPLRKKKNKEFIYYCIRKILSFHSTHKSGGSLCDAFPTLSQQKRLKRHL